MVEANLSIMKLLGLEKIRKITKMLPGGPGGPSIMMEVLEAILPTGLFTIHS